MGIHLYPGLFVLNKDKETVLAEIDSASKSLRREFSDKEILAECRASRERVKALFSGSFVDTRAKKKTIQCLDNGDTDNVILAREYGHQIFYLLYDLKVVVSYSVSFDDLPSCRSLLDYSVEEIQEIVMDLVGNGVIKDIAKTLSIGKDLYHFKEIADVQRYYSDMLALFTIDSDAGLLPTPMEQVFELKCREELEYCKLASLKVTGKLSNELYEKGKCRDDRGTI